MAFFELQDPTQAQTSGFAPLNLKLLNLNSMQIQDVLDIDFEMSGIYLLWSPDSQHLAVFTQLGRTQWTSLIVDVATNKQQHLAASEGTIAIFFSLPDGHQKAT